MIPVILSGGAGTRLWPLSRSLHPKQFHALTGKKTLIQQTALRLKDAGYVNPPLVLCNEDHRFMVAGQLDEVGISPSSIILEPVARMGMNQNETGWRRKTADQLDQFGGLEREVSTPDVLVDDRLDGQSFEQL